MNEDQMEQNQYPQLSAEPVWEPEAAPEEQIGYEPQSYEEEPFVPAPRYRMGKLSKALICVCLVLAGGLGGAAVQKAVDGGGRGQGRISQFQGGTRGGGTGTGTGTGAGTGGQFGGGGGGFGGGGGNRTGGAGQGTGSGG